MKENPKTLNSHLLLKQELTHLGQFCCFIMSNALLVVPKKSCVGLKSLLVLVDWMDVALNVVPYPE